MRKIQILGVGCPKCRRLKANVEEAVRSLGLDSEIEKIEDVTRIASFGVLLTPALVIDGQVRSSGKVLSVEELKKLLEE